MKLQPTNVILDINFKQYSDVEHNTLLSVLYKKILNTHQVEVDDLQGLAMHNFELEPIVNTTTNARLVNAKRHIRVSQNQLRIDPLRIFSVELENFNSIIDVFNTIKQDLELDKLEFRLKTINFICKDEWTRKIYQLLAEKYGEYAVFSNKNLNIPETLPNFTFFSDYLSIWIRGDFVSIDLYKNITMQLRDSIRSDIERTLYRFIKVLDMDMDMPELQKLEVT